ncbi:MAG: 2-isopropylmalate synthase [Candidatus Marinimicrobia bacterium]|nr:2-isopropylmalate synthase [Candidatus Neomarinimicrobiota bacterium]
MMQRILIFDTTLRDGEQSPGASLTIKEKILIAEQLNKLGADIIEAGFPIASPGDFEAVRQIARQIEGPVICGLARAMDKDIDCCWEAVKYAKRPRIHTFIATSDIHRDEKLRKSKEEVIASAVRAVKRARSYCDDVEFSPEDAGRTSLEYMCDVVRAVIEAGATTINIPDTVGYTEPEEFGKRIHTLFEKVPEVRNVVVSVHCHNDLGNAVANSLAAVKAGATQIECCINGIGERAGNASLEEIVMNLKTRSDYFGVETGIITRELYKTSRLVSRLTGLEIARNKAIVGQNAFAHEAGIHQHGVLQSKATYEIMSAEDVGWSGDNIVIGKHSGKHAILALLEDEGYILNTRQSERVVEKVKALADKNKSVERDDVLAIAMDILGELPDKEQHIRLEGFAVTTGSGMTPTASVKLCINGQEKIGAGVGDGPIDALSKAVWSIIDPSVQLLEYNLKAITGGTDALADVSIKLKDAQGRIFSGRAVHEDVIRAGAMAIISGLNRVMNYSDIKK